MRFTKLLTVLTIVPVTAALVALSSWPQSDPAIAIGAANSISALDITVNAYDTSVKLDTNGNPVVTYQDNTNTALKILHCNDPNCTGGDDTIESADSVGVTGQYTSLALDTSGNPVVSYHDATNSRLRILHCDDPSCSSGGESMTSPDSGGSHASLVLDATGNPVVSYGGSTGALKVLHCDDPNCSGGGESITSPDTAGVGHTSLALDGAGNPVVAYYGGPVNQGDLKVLHCDDPNCSAGGESITSPDTAGDVGYDTSLALDGSGNPVVSYFRYINSNGTLKVLHCGNANCTSGNSITSPAGTGQVFTATSLALDASGNPVVSYYQGGLFLLHCNDSTCSGGDESVTIPGTGGFSSALVLDASGNPVVSYGGSTGALKVLHCGNANCSIKPPTATPTRTPTPSPTPCPTEGCPTPTPKLGNSGPLSGLFDLCAGLVVPTGPCTYNPSPANSLYACMVRTDHDSTISAGEQAMKSSLTCGTVGSKTVGAPMPPCALWHGPGPQGTSTPAPVVPGEGNCGVRAGYSAGPPYTWLAPSKLTGFYCQSGPCTAPDGSSVPTDGTWQIGCLADFGTSLGPNIVVLVTSTTAVANNPSVGNSAMQSAKFYIFATNAECSTAQSGGWSGSLSSGHGPFGSVSTLTRRDPARDYDGDGCTDMLELWQDKAGSATKCGDDPWNPYDPTGAAPDVSGSYDMLLRLVRADIGAPGFYYECKTDIQQSGKNLTAKILCVFDSAAITVNPQPASGNPMTGVNNCPPAAPKYCGDGLSGPPPPGCSLASGCAVLAGQGTGCPTLPCDVSQYQFADIDHQHTALTGTLDNAMNTIHLAGCFIADPPEGDGLSQLGNFYRVFTFDAHTGLGTVEEWWAQTRANCIAGTPTGGPLIAQLSAVRQAPGDKSGGCTPNAGVGYTGCRDSDGDGCPDKREFDDAQGTGGLRDPWNPWDYFNPEKMNTPHAQTIADVLYVVYRYGKNQGNALYTIDADRTTLIGGNVWNLGPPDGQQTVADILAAVKQYNMNC